MLDIKSDLLARGHRQLLVISGITGDTILTLTEQLRHQHVSETDNDGPGNTPEKSINWLWFGPECPDRNFRAISASRVQSELGTESHLVVINAHTTFNADATVALAGTLLPGCVLVLLTPPLDQWPITAHPFATPNNKEVTDTDAPVSHYLQRLCSFIHRWSEQISLQKIPDSSSPPPQIRLLRYSPADHPPTDTGKQTTVEQKRLIDDIVNMSNSTEPLSLFVTADRGRGKSAALGIAAASVVNGHRGPVTVIAPTRRAVAVLYQHFQQQLQQVQDEQEEKNTVVDDSLLFLPPDQINHVRNDTRLILVDEAAGIPINLLSQIQALRKPTVYSSTVDGYEGAGRGFAIRFMQTLATSSKPVLTRQLHEPIRWAANDPLEQFCNDALMLSSCDQRLLNTSHLVEHAVATKIDSVTISELSQKELADDESLLEDVFGLLLQAHYRTCPHDLWHLMDGPNLRVFVARIENHLVAAALVATEGPILEPVLRHGIMLQNRRPKGHVLPQLLSQYTMNSNPLDMTLARVVRIAVLPALHRLGIGSRLIQQLESFYQPGSLDAIGAMFGGAPDTINFWQQVGYRCCHLSASAQTSIGYRSVCMLRSLSERAARVQALAEVLHHDKATDWRPAASARSVEASSALKNGRRLTTRSGRTDSHATSELTMTAPMYDPHVLRRYVSGSRSLSDSRCAIARLINLSLYRVNTVGTKNPGITNATVAHGTDSEHQLEKQQMRALTLFFRDPAISMTDLAPLTNTSGKKEAESLLKNSLAHLLQLQTAGTGVAE